MILVGDFTSLGAACCAAVWRQSVVATLKANAAGIRFDFMRWLSAQAKNNYL